MDKKKWLAAALAASLWASATMAGEFTVDLRVGGTELHVDAERLSSGTEVDKGLFSTGIDLAYKWPRGAFLELGLMTSFDPFPIFGWDDLKHTSLAAGWQVSSQNLHFKPKVGITHSRLKSQQEDFFKGNEPVDEMEDLVPFVEATLEYRFFGRFGLGAFVRENFEDFGNTTMWGLTLGWTFQ